MLLLLDLRGGRLPEVKYQRKIQLPSPKGGRGRLQEVVAYERYQMQCFDCETKRAFGKWSLKRGNRLREVVAQRGSTVHCLHHFLVSLHKTNFTPALRELLLSPVQVSV